MGGIFVQSQSPIIIFLWESFFIFVQSHILSELFSYGRYLFTESYIDFPSTESYVT